MRRLMNAVLSLFFIAFLRADVFSEQSMDEMWGEQQAQAADRVTDGRHLVAEGKYAMFIHWGLYSNLANKYRGKTHYGIGEWIMYRTMANIPADEYMGLAADFNPVEFDADEIVRLAKDAGMKYIVFTAKHHDGFAMYASEACDFNIVAATPFDRDPVAELAEACRKYGLGFGLYYSHNQDWTFPGGSGGPATNATGERVGIDYYYQNKCLPQVREITENYGPLDIIWFDTPGSFPRRYVEELVQVVRENQPGALISSRVGYGLGDYVTLGDMEVPNANVDGLWETVDTTNDSWAYAWYDTLWKSPKEIVERLASCVARGGTYMLNIGPRGDGSIPAEASEALRRAGKWLEAYPQVIYGAGASPWGRPMPWGDVTIADDRLHLAVFRIPPDRQLRFQGLKSDIAAAKLLDRSGGPVALDFMQVDDWTTVVLPDAIAECVVPVVELTLESAPKVEAVWGVDPGIETTILSDFAQVHNARRDRKSWMEKFGEWKHAVHVHDWKDGGKASWRVSVLKPGFYRVSLTYTGEGRLVWGVENEGHSRVQNQQNSSSVYQKYPIGWIRFESPGEYTLSVSCLDGNRATASLKAIHLEPAMLDRD